MLQRRQTLWMALALICAVLTFKLSFYHGQVPVGQHGLELRYLTAWPHYINGRSGSILILIVTIALIIGIGWNIFNFKTRSKQLWITVGLIVLSLVNIALYWYATLDFNGDGGLSLSALVVLAIPVFLFMAARGIRKDDKLVKSADRLR